MASKSRGGALGLRGDSVSWESSRASLCATDRVQHSIDVWVGSSDPQRSHSRETLSLWIGRVFSRSSRDGPSPFSGQLSIGFGVYLAVSLFPHSPTGVS